MLHNDEQGLLILAPVYQDSKRKLWGSGERMTLILSARAMSKEAFSET